MKKTNLLTLAVLCVAFAFTSCSKSDDSAVECHECHIAFISDGVEVEVPILNDGEESFSYFVYVNTFFLSVYLRLSK